MRRLVLTIVAAGLSAALAGCNKSSTGSQPAQTSPSGAAQNEPTDAQKKALVAQLPAPYSGGDLDNGEVKFQICKSCHTITEGGPNMTGPNLYGIFGRKIGTQPGFKYSDPVKAQSFTWDADHLDKWLTDPKAMIPNTKMTFVGFKDQKDRIDVIAYLKAMTSPPPT